MYYLIILVLLFLAELFYFRIADKCNIIDKPNERSSHTRITLRGGGIIFYFGVLAYFLTSHFEYPWFMLALTLITFISFVDDIRSTSSTPTGVSFLRHGFDVLSMGVVFTPLVDAFCGIDRLYGYHQCLQFHGWHQWHHRRIFIGCSRSPCLHQ